MSRLMNIPEGWTSSTLGEQTDILCGKAFSSSEYVEPEHGTLLLRGDNIGQGFLRWRDAKAWPEQENENLDKYHLREGDIVLAMDRPWIPAGLKVSEVSERDLPSLLVQRVARLRAKNGFSQSLVKQILSGHQFVEYVKGSKTESAVPHISAKDIKEFPIAVPTEVEQQKIVEILSDCDTAIENAIRLSLSESKALNAEIMAIIQKAFNQSLPLQDFVTLDKGRKVAISETGEGKPYLGSQALEGNILDYSEDTDGLGCLSTDVLLLWDGENAGRAATNLEGIVSSTVMRLRPNNPNLNEFISGILRTNFRRIQAMREGSGVPHLPADFIKRFKLPDIDLSQQIEIGNYFAEARKANEVLKERIVHLKKQKRGLMQQLLTGKLRVKGAA